jgi:hypothetical protein
MWLGTKIKLTSLYEVNWYVIGLDETLASARSSHDDLLQAASKRALGWETIHVISHVYRTVNIEASIKWGWERDDTWHGTHHRKTKASLQQQNIHTKSQAREREKMNRENASAMRAY